MAQFQEGDHKKWVGDGFAGNIKNGGGGAD